MPRSKRKHLKRFIICLCLAPVLVVAVAWGCALVGFEQSLENEIEWNYDRPSPRMFEVFRSHHNENCSENPDDFHSQVTLGFTWSDLWYMGDQERGECGITAREIGFPFRCLWDYVAISTTEAGRYNTEIVGSFSSRVWPIRNAPMSFLPIYPGFIGNALLYAVVMWGVWTGVVAFKRRRRVRRGLCPACTYDLTGLGSAECPECGESLPPA